jgi:hypothetical protein
MGEPPFEEGAVQERETCPLLGVAVKDWGTEGTPMIFTV